MAWLASYVNQTRSRGIQRHQARRAERSESRCKEDLGQKLVVDPRVIVVAIISLLGAVQWKPY